MFLTQWSFLLPVSLAYLFLVRKLRFSRCKSIPLQLGYTSRATFPQMTLEDAWKIHNYLIEYEFPATFSAATMFALFNSYGVPSISSLLCITGQFSSKDTVDKRYADTGCLLLEAVLNPPSSERSIEAISRINYLHSAHLKTGKIRDADMLYTLSLFALQPSRWVAKYEWRELTSVERCAVGTLWKRLGEALGVKYDSLPGYRTGWKDGLEWMKELDCWSREYQNANMAPAATNRKVAEATIYHITWPMPKFLKPVGEQLVAAILEENLREAMMIPRPPQSYYVFINTFIAIRKFVLLHLTLPRLKAQKRLPIATPAGRIYARKYTISPWYIKPTLMKRWGPKALIARLKGNILPGDGGGKYFPQGFVAAELGPTALREYGQEQMEVDKQRLSSEAMSEVGRCPFLSPKN